MSNKIQRINSVYGVKSFEDAAATAASYTDAGGVILARNLEHVSTEIFTQEFPELTLLSQGGVEVNNEGSGATSVLKVKMAINGDFAEIGDNTDGTGKVSLSGEDDSIPVWAKQASSEWSEMELLRADRQGINLPNRFLAAHSELYNRQIDSIGYVGQLKSDGSSRAEGLLNFSGFTSTAASGTAASLTGDQLYQEIADFITDQWNSVLNVETYKADRVVLPTGAYNAMTKKVFNSAGSAMTVRAALEANFPEVTFITTAKANDVGGNTVAVAYSSNRRAMQLRIPDPLMVSNVWNLGSKYGVESFFGIAGLDVIENAAGRILTGL